jgi:uncharacterized protein
MNTLNFLDANVWFALIWSRHWHSEKAQEWFARSAEEKFFYCRITQITILRLLTTSSVMGTDTREMAGAWELWDKVCDDERVAFLPEPEALEREFRRLSALRTPSPKVWADSYLLAFACVGGLKLVTFDRGLRAKGADVLML